MTRSNAQADRAGDGHRDQHRAEHGRQVAAAPTRSPVQSAMPPITLVATKAPSAMNTPWPKFSTSIRPNTSVRPDAMMKTIMPIARPATVSVTQVDRAADQRQADRRERGQQRERLPVEAGPSGSRRGVRQCDGGVIESCSLMRPQRQARAALLQRLVVGQLAPSSRCARPAVVHHRDAVAERLAPS